MVDQVFVEQDPEPDIADPAHRTNSHVHHNHHQQDRNDRSYNSKTRQGGFAQSDAHSQPSPGVSTGADQTRLPLDANASKGQVAHIRSAEVPYDYNAYASTKANGIYTNTHANTVLPAPALPLDSPFAPSTATANSSDGEKDHNVATITASADASVGHGGRKNEEGAPPATRHTDYAYGRDAKHDGGKEGPAQVTPAHTPAGYTHDPRGVSFEEQDQDGCEDHHDGGKEVFPKFTLRASAINTMKGCPILFALPILIPVAWALELTHQGDVAIFVTCLLAIIPLAGGISFATEELALRLGEVYGGLLNATFGNLVELLIAIIALVKGEIDIVQASMIGSILSNLLLVLGCSYFAGGLRFHEQMYGIPAAQMQIGLLGITLLAVALPSAYHWAYPNSVSVDSIPSGAAPGENELRDLLQMSRGISFILLAIYAMFLTFQLYTHAYLFRMPRVKMVHPLPGPVPRTSAVFPKPNWVASLGDSSSSSTSSRDSSNGGTGNGRFRRFRRWSVRSRSENPDEHEREHENAAERQQESSFEQRLSPSISIDQHAAHYGPGNGNVNANGHITIIEPNGAVSGLAARRSPNLMPMDPPAPGATTPTEAAARIATSHHHLKRGNPLTSAAVRQLEAHSAAEEGLVGAKVVKDNTGHQQPVISIWFALGLLTAVTVLAGVTAEFLVSSIDGLTTTSGVSREFVGLILLPVIGNSVEHITAVTVSVKDKLNLSMSIAIGSSIQVSLCILPILVLIAWPLGQPLTLYFDPFETITLVVAVLLVNFAISDGRTNYLEGFVMMMAYICIALVCWFYNPIR